MPNKNKNPQSQRRRGQRVQRRNQVPARASALIPFLDPFSASAAGAKWPDGAGAATTTFQIIDRYELSTDASGSIAVCVNFGTLNNAWTPGTVDEGAISWTMSLDVSTLSSLVLSLHRYRITSAGARFIPTGASDANGGAVYLTNAHDRPISISEAINGQLLPLRAGFTAIATPMGPNARQFVTPGDMDNSDWSRLTAIVQGGPASSPVGIMEVYRNIEATPLKGTITAHLPRTVAPLDPGVEHAVVASYSKMPITTLQEYPSMVTQVVSMLASHLTAAGAGALGFRALGQWTFNRGMRAYAMGNRGGAGV